MTSVGVFFLALFVTVTAALLGLVAYAHQRKLRRAMRSPEERTAELDVRVRTPDPRINDENSS